MAKKIRCKNCGKEIQSDFLSCPYCRMDLDTTADEIDNKEETDIEGSEDYSDSDESEEYYEEDDYTESDSENEDDEEEEEDVEEEEEEYYEEDDYEDAVNDAEEDVEENQQEEYETKDFQPIKAKFIDKKTKKSTKQTEIVSYEANEDHYYDDILPEVLDDINNNTLETVAKIVGMLILLVFVMWYLIYFL